MGHFGISEGSITTTPPPPKKSNLRIQTKKAITRGELPHSLVSTHDEWGLCIEAPSSSSVFRILIFHLNVYTRDFPGGPVVKNLPSNAEDANSIPVRELSYHMPWGN